MRGEESDQVFENELGAFRKMWRVKPEISVIARSEKTFLLSALKNLYQVSLLSFLSMYMERTEREMEGSGLTCLWRTGFLPSECWLRRRTDWGRTRLGSRVLEAQVPEAPRGHPGRQREILQQTVGGGKQKDNCDAIAHVRAFQTLSGALRRAAKASRGLVQLSRTPSPHSYRPAFRSLAHRTGTGCQPRHLEKGGGGPGLCARCRPGTSGREGRPSGRDPGSGQVHERQPGINWFLVKKSEITRTYSLNARTSSRRSAVGLRPGGTRRFPASFCGQLTRGLITHLMESQVFLKAHSWSQSLRRNTHACPPTPSPVLGSYWLPENQLLCLVLRNGTKPLVYHIHKYFSPFAKEKINTVSTYYRLPVMVSVQWITIYSSQFWNP